MASMFELPFSKGRLPYGWEIGPSTASFNEFGAAINPLCPIVLHHVQKELAHGYSVSADWTNLQQLTQGRQVGCIKGKQMLHCIEGVSVGFDTMSQGAPMSFDFSNAFPSLIHWFITAELRLIQLPSPDVACILSTVMAPYHCCVGTTCVSVMGLCVRWLSSHGPALVTGIPSPSFCLCLFGASALHPIEWVL